VARLIANGDLPSRKAGRRRLIARAVVEEYVNGGGAQ
jgi:excisionase family DNA binding protein